MEQATVVRNAGSRYELSALPEWRPFPAVLRGKVRLGGSSSTNPVAVGDRVLYCEGENGAPAQITGVLPRDNYLIRRSTNLSRRTHVIASNLDRVFVVCTLYFPELKLPFLDRLLVTCGVYRIPVTILLNKIDLYAEEAPEQVERFVKIYRSAGYEVLPLSAAKGQGVDGLKALCSSGVNLFCGESGVGKSTLLKAVNPALSPRTGGISVSHLQGCHTTSLYEMFPSGNGGFIIDMPGLRGFGLVDLEKEEIYKYFPEMLAASAGCRFTPCTHTHEPGCAVKEAVDAGEIFPERYNSYLGMLEEDRKFR